MSLPCYADEGSVAAAKRLKRIPPMNPHAPVLSKEDYFTVPPVKRLRRFTDNELRVTQQHGTWEQALLIVHSVVHAIPQMYRRHGESARPQSKYLH